MKKNILVLLLTVSILALNGGCTSKESQEDDQTIENADVEKIETIDNGDVALSDGDMSISDAPAGDAPAADASAPPTADDAALEASLNEPTSSDTPAATDAPPPEVTSAEPPPPDVAAATPTIDESSLAGTEAPPITDADLAPDPALTAPPTDATATVADTGSGLTETPVFSSDVQPTPVSKPAAAGSALKKVAMTTPYQSKNGGWINTVYVARPGEKLADISQKIFGSDKTKDLKAISENNFLKWRAPRGGDKIYYVSPNRPDDSARTILYYEDMGMVPETYIAKSGDDLKKVSKELLGYDGAWKEVWTSNAMESKSKLKEGEMIRYWKSGAEVMAMAPPSPPPQPMDTAAAPPPMPPPPADGAAVVDASQAPQQTAQTAPPQPMDQAGLPPPPPDAGAGLPPPPPDGTAAAGTDVAAAPPPPTDEAAPPPPPPPVEDGGGDAAAAAPVDGADEKKDLDAATEEEDEAAGDTDLMMSMGALGILVALLAFVIIRKKKQKSQMNNLEMNA